MANNTCCVYYHTQTQVQRTTHKPIQSTNSMGQCRGGTSSDAGVVVGTLEQHVLLLHWSSLDLREPLKPAQRIGNKGWPGGQRGEATEIAQTRPTHTWCNSPVDKEQNLALGLDPPLARVQPCASRKAKGVVGGRGHVCRQQGLQ